MNDAKWKCCSCGKENTENAKFCALCGQPKKWRCAKCETLLPYVTEKCMICNTTSEDSLKMWKIRTLEKSTRIENYENIDNIFDDIFNDKVKNSIDNNSDETEYVKKSDISAKEEKRKEKDISDIEDVDEIPSRKSKESKLNKKLVICIVILSVLLLVVVIFTILNTVLAYDSIDEGQIYMNDSSYERIQELNDYDEESIYYDL
ncbi:MAG: zinc ribbon domain-containing protein [Ruminococcus sp.]|nr:zinc ribbon domain-containing protein [Ruminococcus sp.]